jgi:hypothetical protein
MTDQIDDPFGLPLDDVWDVEPGDDGDIHDPEAILARMRASCWSRGRGWMKLDPHEQECGSSPLSLQRRPHANQDLRPSGIEQVAGPALPGFVV